jgi:hypothetical protein
MSADGENCVSPHTFMPLRRWFNRGRCRACFLPPAKHPTTSWVPSRPWGDKRLPVTPTFDPEAERVSA